MENISNLRTCWKCKKDKPISCFRIKKSTNKAYGPCKECKSILDKEDYQKHLEKRISSSKKYYEKNKEKCNSQARAYSLKNKEKIAAQNKERRLANLDEVRKCDRERRSTPEEKLIRSAYLKEYVKKNKEDLNRKKREKYVDKYKNDIQYRILSSLRARINVAVKKVRTEKKQRSCSLLGCSIEEYIMYLQSQFTPEMNWENYGKYWSIDHIKPCCSFDLTKEEEQLKCFNYKNTRPLTVRENLIKLQEDVKKSIKHENNSR